MEDIRLVAELDIAMRSTHTSVLYRWERVDFNQRNLRHVYSICANNRRLNKQLPVSRIIFIVPFPPPRPYCTPRGQTHVIFACLRVGYMGICVYITNPEN